MAPERGSGRAGSPSFCLERTPTTSERGDRATQRCELCAAQGQVEVTPESTQLPAVQQTPAEQELLPAQRASQLVPPQ